MDMLGEFGCASFVGCSARVGSPSVHDVLVAFGTVMRWRSRGGRCTAKALLLVVVVLLLLLLRVLRWRII
jgi:hypothetical protein